MARLNDKKLLLKLEKDTKRLRRFARISSFLILLAITLLALSGCVRRTHSVSQWIAQTSSETMDYAGIRTEAKMNKPRSNLDK